MEILTGVERRRRWPDELKAKIVAESLGAGVSVSEIARRYDIRTSQVQLWRKQAREGQLVLPTEEARTAFAPVVLAPPTAKPVARPPSAAVEIEAGAVRVRIRAGVEADVVEAIVRALAGRA
jgi:transposase